MNRAQIGAALRALRLASGKEAKAVARSALMSPSKLSKIENARLAPSATDVERVLTAIGVSDEVKAEYADAARARATEAAAWRLLKRIGVHKGQQAAKALEAQMSTLQLFQPALVPGLLQTPEYIRDGRMVTIETVHAEVVVTDPRDVDLYTEKFNGFAAVALSNEKMHRLLEAIRDDLLRERETG
ncbi:Scr1 family TA system antitoxin-like transcriptional regulator [Streptomyces koyangensis]